MMNQEPASGPLNSDTRTANKIITEPDTIEVVPAIAQLWLLRILCKFKCGKMFIKNFWHYDETVYRFDLDQFDEKCDTSIISQHLFKQYSDLEEKKHTIEIPPPLAKNVAALANVLDLTDTDCRLLEFIALLRVVETLREGVELLGHIVPLQLAKTMSLILDIPEKDISSSLSKKGALCRSGLVVINNGNLIKTFRLISSSFAESLISPMNDLLSLLQDVVSECEKPVLTINDFNYLHGTLKILKPYMENAVKTKRHGVNIFVYGPSGTGKSQLSKVLAEELGVELFEVSSEDRHGTPMIGDERLQAFSVAQNFLSSHKAMLLFDEVEDVFSDGLTERGGTSAAQTKKAWFNYTLEHNPVPTLWLSNSVRCLDNAFIRRFDMVVELATPPKDKRIKLINELCGEFLTSQTVLQIAESKYVSPGVLTKAATVIATVKNNLNKEDSEKALINLLQNTLKAQNYPRIQNKKGTGLPDFYDPSFVNCSVDLEKIADGISRNKNARLCLYGPPGTGKTAFGRWLSVKLDMPLHAKKASDLINMYIGETEKNIARTFRMAKHENAILLIDEVDSFLRDRRDATRPWEVSQVNEMLTQMESFNGVFIASTNLMVGLDQASLRRFDLKILFDFLKKEQSASLLKECCIDLALEAPTDIDLVNLSRLDVLTPGDFAAVIRQHRFRPIDSAQQFVLALEDECSAKEVSKKIGFVY